MIVTADFGRFDDPTHYASTGNGGSLNLAYNLFEGSKLGFSTFHGSIQGTQRTLTGPYAIIGLTQHLVLLSEFYFQWQSTPGALEQKGPTSYNRLQYEFVKGVHGYVEAQFQRLDLTAEETEIDAYSLGFNFYPRPHIELLGNVGKMRIASPDGQTPYADIVWGQVHYYF